LKHRDHRGHRGSVLSAQGIEFSLGSPWPLMVMFSFRYDMQHPKPAWTSLSFMDIYGHPRTFCAAARRPRGVFA
jgi:hypothetical protein